MTAAVASPHIFLQPGKIRIDTQRLTILSVNTDEYNEELIALYGSKKVNQLVGTGSTLERDAVAAKIQRWHKRWAENNPFSGYVVIEKDSGKFVGQIILKPVKNKAAGPGHFIEGVAEIGYLSMPEHWGKGYGHEYTHAMVHHLLPKLIASGYRVAGHPITSVMATARIDNIASNCVLKKSMTHTGTKERYGAPREWYEHRFSANLIGY